MDPLVEAETSELFLLIVFIKTREDVILLQEPLETKVRLKSDMAAQNPSRVNKFFMSLTSGSIRVPCVVRKKKSSEPLEKKYIIMYY